MAVPHKIITIYKYTINQQFSTIHYLDLFIYFLFVFYFLWLSSFFFLSVSKILLLSLAAAWLVLLKQLLCESMFTCLPHLFIFICLRLIFIYHRKCIFIWLLHTVCSNYLSEKYVKRFWAHVEHIYLFLQAFCLWIAIKSS